DDLIGCTVRLFMEHPKVLSSYQKLFKHVLIDEYQDTNHAQYRLVRCLAKSSGNVFAVGDEDQSIYGFRGADITNILDFQKDFSSSKLYKLEENYRSTQNILRCANGLITNNTERIGKTLWTKNEVGSKIMRNFADTEHQEVDFVVKTIKELYRKRKHKLGDMVVFYRVHALSRVLEEGLRRANVPYEIVGGVGFYGRREIKDIMAYIKLVAASGDDVSLMRVINVPARGVGATSLQAVSAYAKKKKIHLYEAVKHCAEIQGLSGKAKNGIAGFLKMVEDLRNLRDELTASEMLAKIIEKTGYVKLLKEERTEDAKIRIENINELRSAAVEFEERSEDKSTARFLEEISLFSDVDLYEEDNDKVTLMTVHAAKGLQFGVVFLVGMEKGIFPYIRSVNDNGAANEEERRLCYVALTRAKKQIYLSAVQSRLLYGTRTNNELSPFVREMPQQLLEDIYSLKGRSFDPEEREHAGAQGGKASAVSFSDGAKVTHPKFGKGRIVKVVGQGEDMRLSVKFNSQPGPMLLMARFANLTKV
ncbi:ATP-dependent helicase, partial [Candidatus Auribacterota bacterium]